MDWKMYVKKIWVVMNGIQFSFICAVTRTQDISHLEGHTGDNCIFIGSTVCNLLMLIQFTVNFIIKPLLSCFTALYRG